MVSGDDDEWAIPVPHFEHEWQRESWEREREEVRRAFERKAEPEPVIDTVESMMAKILPREEQPERKRCPAPRWASGSGELGQVSCDRFVHLLTVAGGTEVVERCPLLVAEERMERKAKELERLKGTLTQLVKRGGSGFDGYDGNRHDGAKQALEAMRRFSSGSPTGNVILSGSTGLGKTRLLLASHFALLERGVVSQYVTSPELRQVFRNVQSFNADDKHLSQVVIDRLIRAEVIHADDLGDIEDDQRKRGEFAEGLKGILDRSQAAWAVALNMSAREAENHPDLGGKIVSRLLLGAEIVVMSGRDFRAESARRL